MNEELVFEGAIEIYVGNPYVTVTHEQANRLKAGWKKPMPVIIQINDQPTIPWRINMMPKGDGSFYLYLHGDVRRASNTKVGDIVSVRVTFDENYVSGPVDEMPKELADAISQNNTIKANWGALPPSRKKEVLRYLGRIRSPQIVSENIGRLIPVLEGKDGHYLGRDWHNGR